MAVSPAALIRRYYSRVDDGFEIPREEEKVVRAARGAPGYGEIMPAAATELGDYLQLGSDDVFYDLGSGTGKLINQLALVAPARRLVGVELSRSRVRTARSVLRKLRAEQTLAAKTVVHRHQGILEANLDDASVIYTCSTEFSTRFLRAICNKVRKLPRAPLFVTLQEIDIDQRGFEPLDTLRLDMSWRSRSAVHVYRATPTKSG